MPEVFYGRWSVRVLDSHFPQRQRFEISGSDASDGVYPGTPDSTVSVTGAQWTLAMSRRENDAWRASALRRNSASPTRRGWLSGWAPTTVRPAPPTSTTTT
jgi:hypothetical protein